MSLSQQRKAAAHAAVDAAVRAALESAGRPRRAPWRNALERLLGPIRGRSALLRPAVNRDRGEPDAAATVLSGLLALAAHFKEWRRPPEAWVPESPNPRAQFLALAHHLLAEYPVPAFMATAWLRGQDPGARQSQRWYLHLAQGGSVRTAGFPGRLNRVMAYCFTQAPENLSIEHALRWGQVLGLGGSERLATAVAASRLGARFENDDFWVTVLQFFVNQRKLDPANVGLLVGYLHHQKFECERVIIGDDTEIWLDPPQPELSMKGRTLPALLRRASEWRAQQAPPRAVRRRFEWAPSALGGLQHRDYSGRTWDIRELLDSDELACEGKVMHHCVAEYYVEPCVRRETTIWSLGVETPRGRERILTVQVDPESRTVVQASMHCNGSPDAWCRSMLERWAAQEALTIECLTEEPVGVH